MKLYHTSNVRIPSPDTRHSRNHLDFGRGFYLTPLEEQARNYGQRFIRRGEAAVMNIYQFSDDIGDAMRKTFIAYDGDWLEGTELPDMYHLAECPGQIPQISGSNRPLSHASQPYTSPAEICAYHTAYSRTQGLAI